ncbi:MAG: hypothetical protein WBE13_13115 [Candidatus Acidiferrum sp.]
MTRVTTTIKRVWLDKILAHTKKIEYREIKPYWTKRLKNIEVPFELRLINGMSKRAPECTLLIKKVDIGFQPILSDDEEATSLEEGAVYRLHIGKILAKKNV